MRVLVAGTWRSGTTALFNLVRIICEPHGGTYAVFDDQYNEAIGEEFDFEIVKVHKFRHEWIEWADVIITIWREPGDVLESMRRFFRDQDDETIVADFGRGLTWWGLYNHRADYEAHYAQLKRSTEKMARHIGEVIGIDVAEKEIVRAFLKIRPPAQGVDPVTLLHSNHITK